MPNELTVREELEQLQPQFKDALHGTGIEADKFVLVVTTALRINPDLRNCDRRSLMNAAMKAAADGLLPDGRDGALVPFQGKVTWMPMISGIRKKVRRTGEVSSWDVTAVHAKDKFDFELGDNPWIRHKPWKPTLLERGAEETEEAFKERLRRHIDPGPCTFVYSVATLKGGHKSRDVMSRAEVEYIRDGYARRDRKGEHSPMWRKSFDEAAKKTIARRHAKQLPMASDIVGLLNADNEHYKVNEERGERVQAPSELNARLESLTGFDPETGEIFDETAEGVRDDAPLQRDGVSTPPSHSAAFDDASGGRIPGVEEVAHSSGAITPGSSGERDGRVATNPVTEPALEPIADSDAQAPPGAVADTPSPAPGGSRKTKAKPPDLLTPSIEQRGEQMALRGRQPLEQWVMELPADEMAKVSLAQLKAWRAVADKAGA